jgi:sulfonate transport system permease protein
MISTQGTTMTVSGITLIVRLRRASQWGVPLLLLLCWQAGTTVGLIRGDILPSPIAVFAAGWQLLLSGELLRNVEISAWRAAAGFAIGGGIGFALGLMNGLSSLSERLLDSTLQMIRNIPHLALIPLVILWFGIGEEAKLFLVALGVFFPLYVNTMHGVRSVDSLLIEMGRAYGMSKTELIRRVILPGALPSIFVGLRYGLGITWLTLIVAETISASSGIGYMAMNAREFMLVDVVMFSILIYAALGKLADSTARLLERFCLAWNPVYREP